MMNLRDLQSIPVGANLKIIVDESYSRSLSINSEIKATLHSVRPIDEPDDSMISKDRIIYYNNIFNYIFVLCDLEDRTAFHEIPTRNIESIERILNES
jgi:hypothetical protein